jgi:hypothetical protein
MATGGSGRLTPNPHWRMRAETRADLLFWFNDQAFQ